MGSNFGTVEFNSVLDIFIIPLTKRLVNPILRFKKKTAGTSPTVLIFFLL